MPKHDGRDERTAGGSTAPTPQERTDTGLHISMRALLAIIAGLLVADAVKACVMAVTIGAVSDARTWNNAALAVAGTLFVTRVVTDNFLYYADTDVVTGFEDYWTRVFLIAFDIASYAACYAVVARITLPEGANSLTTAAVRWSITYATVVEFLHAAWCFVALRYLHIERAEDRETRIPWLQSWLRIAAISAGIGIVLSAAAWWTLRPGVDPITTCLALASVALSLSSLVAYLDVMRLLLRRRAI